MGSITRRLFFSFGVLVINIIIISSLAMFFLWRTGRIGEITHQINHQSLLVIELLNNDLDFLRFETVNTHYFESGESAFLDKRDSLLALIQKNQKFLQDEMAADDKITERKFKKLDSLLTRYNSTFRQLIVKINERGFKDYGLEGEMRGFAHELESANAIPIESLLTLRRHEKDFLLRREDIYIFKFNALADEIYARLQHHRQNDIAKTLINYQTSFSRVTKLHYEIGLTPSEGLFGALNSHSRRMSAILLELKIDSNARRDGVVRNSAMLFIGISLVLIVLSTILTYYTSTRLARPIQKLSNSMGKFIVNEGLNERELEAAIDTDEISHLSQSFIKMSRKLKTQFTEIVHQNKELKQLNNELDRFIYSAAHDLKSPLASLDGLLRLAEIEINSQPHAHYFTMMKASVKKLNGFISDITDYAKNKRQTLSVEPVDLSAMVQEIIDGVRFLPESQKIDIQVKIDGGELFTDRTRLEIILKNLITNSIIYMDYSKSNSYVKVEGYVTDDHLSLTISDNGIGIGKEHLARIFDMFYRASVNSKGTGIGLFLVKESVKMLRGKIKVKSRLSEWTIFYLRIPNFKFGKVLIPETDDVVQAESIEDTVES